MKRSTGWRGLILGICVAFGAVACGDDDPSKNTNTSTNATTNNTSTNVNNEDLCADVSCTGDEAAPTCDGDEVVQEVSEGCNPETGMCESSEVRSDCAANGQICMNGFCVDGEDPCNLVDCSAPEATCDGDVAVEVAAGTCEPSTGMCVDGDETRIDCTETDQVCMDGMCVDDTGPCTNVTCDQPSDTCDGQERVEYSGAGVCEMLTGECDYSAVETRTDCTDTGQICLNGACAADDDDSVNPGDLVITEFMQNPRAVADSKGEWFEIYNATPRTLDIEGIQLDDGGNRHTVAGPGGTFSVPGFGFVVVGRTDVTDDQDPDYNGGVQVDIVFDNMSLANASDTITILAPDGNTVIDEVAYDDGATFPDGNGVAAMFGGENDPLVDDNADGQFWCEAVSTYGAGDFGTPGAANDPCPQPVVTTIYDIQDTGAANHPAANSPLILEDVVITALGDRRLWVQEPAGGKYSGIYVAAFSLDLTGLSVGDVVRLEGTYDESGGSTAGLTTFRPDVLTPANMQMAISPEVVPATELATEVGAEPWESVLIQVVEVGITNSNPDSGGDFGDFRVDASVRVGTFLYDYDTAPEGDPQNCWSYESITGPLNYSFGAFEIIPRDASDMVLSDATLTSDGAASTVMVGMGGLNFSPQTICVDSSATVTWDWSAGLHDIESRDAGSMMPAAAKVLDSPDLMMPGDSFSFTFNDPGSYHYLCSYHPTAMVGQVIVLE